MLMDHADTPVDCILRGLQLYLFPADADVAFTRLLHPEHDLHQGRLTCPVLARYGMNFSFAQAKVDILVGNDTIRIYLGYSPHFQQRVFHGLSTPFN
ncbi:hypothetical protein D3C76_1374570 [compost metagenome]